MFRHRIAAGGTSVKLQLGGEKAWARAVRSFGFRFSLDVSMHSDDSPGASKPRALCELCSDCGNEPRAETKVLSTSVYKETTGQHSRECRNCMELHGIA